MTTLEERVPSCPIFFAITKLLTVVAEPSMIRMATNLSVRNPSFTAIGRNGTKTNKFHKSSNGRWFDLSKSFFDIEGSAHRHESHWSGDISNA